MVGELQDNKMAEAAAVAAANDCLVFSSLDVKEPLEAILRLINMGVSPSVISSSLAAIVSQRLMRSICNHCKENYSVSIHDLKAMGFNNSDLKNINHSGSLSFFRGKGCGWCLGTGYQGSESVFDLFIINNAIRRKIMDKNFIDTFSLQEVWQSAVRAEALKKALNGITTLEEVLRMT